MKEQKIKCVVWDLDNTIWQGVLSENDELTLKDGVVETIRELDERGILQSISSKNDYVPAMERLQAFGLNHYFLYPQINWGPKSNSIKKIREILNIGIDTFAFIDDQIFEREEIRFSLPEVLCIDAQDIHKILDMHEMNPKYLTKDARNRRQLYLNDMHRNKMEEAYEGPKEDFLGTLGMKFVISKAKEDDLKRVEELTNRTNQLNSTGITYAYEELVELLEAPDYDVYVSQLRDKFGDYGKIGIAVIKRHEDIWNIRLLLMSCRVMSKGVGTVMLNYIMEAARRENVRLCADFIHTDRNRMMYITYKFGGFQEIGQEDDVIKFEVKLEEKAYPEYVDVIVS